MNVPMAILAPTGAAAAIGAVLAVRQYPRAGLVAWLVTVAAIPVWFGVNISYYFQPASLMGIVVGVALMLRPPGRLCLGDILMSFFVISCVTPLLTGGATDSTIFVVLAQWLVGFLVGRLAPQSISFDWISSAIAVVFTVVGIWAIVEYVLQWHVFVDIGPANGLRTEWSSIQGRGGQERSEGAFGHSIALGASLALALPFALAAKFNAVVRVAMCAVMLGGVVFTFSRVSLICAAASLALTVLFVREERITQIRIPIVVLLGVAGAIAVPMLLTVFADAGTEASESGEYRGRLTDLIAGIDLLGFSSMATRSATGVLRFGSFRSIDNALLLTGLTYGAVALVIVFALLAIGGWVLLSGRGSPAVASVIAQIPAFVSVALITQYSMFLWFVVGLAVASTVRQLPDVLQRTARENVQISRSSSPPERSLHAVE